MKELPQRCIARPSNRFLLLRLPGMRWFSLARPPQLHQILSNDAGLFSSRKKLRLQHNGRRTFLESISAAIRTRGDMASDNRITAFTDFIMVRLGYDLFGLACSLAEMRIGIRHLKVFNE